MLDSMRFWEWPARRSLKAVACLHKLIDMMWILHGDDMLWELKAMPWQNRDRILDALGLLPTDLPDAKDCDPF